MSKTAARFYAVRYVTNMMQAEAPVLLLGHVVHVKIGRHDRYEAYPEDGYAEWAKNRGVDSLFERINFETWPELLNPSAFFEMLRQTAEKGAGMETLRDLYGIISAVQIEPVDPPAFMIINRSKR